MIGLEKKLNYQTPTVNEAKILLVRLMATPVDKQESTFYSNEVSFNLYPEAINDVEIIKNVTTCVDSNKTISLHADTYKSVHWQIARNDNFENCPGTYGYVFTLPTQVAGTYKVRANIVNKYNQSVQSTVTTVTVEPTAKITNVPEENKIIYFNKTDNSSFLKVEATGKDLSYKWECSFDNGKTWQTYEHDSGTDTIKILTNQREMQYRAIVFSGNKDCRMVTAKAIKVTAIDDFKLNLRSNPVEDFNTNKIKSRTKVFIAGRQVTFEVDAPNNCQIDWDLYPDSGDGHERTEYSTYSPDEKTVRGGKSTTMTMPTEPGLYVLKATMIDKINNENKYANMAIRLRYPDPSE